MIDRSNYLPMWTVTRPGDQHPLATSRGLGDALYKCFSGHNAERRANLFAQRHGLRVSPGMGDRNGWVCIEGWCAEQFIAAVAVLVGRMRVLS